MMNVLLASIVGVLCALVAGLAVGGIAWVILELCGVDNRNRRAVKLGMLCFGLPAGLVGFGYGYVLGANLVPPDQRAEAPTAAVATV